MDWQQEKPHVQCVDTWPSGTCSKATMKAYAVMEQRQQIAIQKVQVGSKSQQVVVLYLSTIPHDWAREELKKAREEILTGGATDEQPRL